MAEASISEDQFCCPVCLDLLNDPVTILCGHSYCISCITDCWNQDDQTGIYSCPQCRQAFTPRPVLGKNTMLADVVEKLKNTKLQSSGPAQCYAGPEDVECDACTGRRYKAVKSCLVCLNSYCPNHLEQHDRFFKDKRHSLIDATGRLDELICYEHNRPLEVFCRTDQECICFMCMMESHKNHDTERASAERRDKQRQLKERQKKFKRRIQLKEKKLQELRDSVESHKRSAQAAVKDSERIFTELIRSIERSRFDVTQLIREQEKAAVSKAKGLLEQLEQEIDDLRRRDAELELLAHTDDHIHFLQRFQSLSALPESTDLDSITVSSHLSFDDVETKVTLLKGKLEDFCKEEIENILNRVKYIQIILPPNPKTREEFLQYSCQLSLDPNTAYKSLFLSEQNKIVINTNTDQQYPKHPDRFSLCPQVLCKESVCGRSYWEVELRGTEDNWVAISVAYKSIGRNGNTCLFGCNNQSWGLLCCSSDYSKFCHNNKKLNCPISSSKIGVYVDHSAGTLAFYNISNKMTLIHRVQTTFTQPLYPGFRVNDGSAVKLCDLTM
nr:tripartite motif-containing protein 16-like [Misgurnus anguillicaudatus]